MQVTSRTHLQIRLQHSIFIGLLISAIILIAWLSSRYEIKADWTVNNRHTLSEASQKLLAELSDPIIITAYASHDDELRKPIKELVERYQREKTDVSLRFVDPFTVPGEVRERGIQIDGEIIIDYQGRTEHVQEAPQRLSEQDLTSALQRLARTDNRLIVFLEGHGERNPTDLSDHNLSQWTQELKNSGFTIETLNFGEASQIPEDTNVLVIANPQTQLLPKEITLLEKYIDQGGNLLWLLDTETSVIEMGLEPFAQRFGLTVQPGMIVDPVSRFFGVDNPAVVSVTTTGYAHHPVTSGFEDYFTLFPQAKGLTIDPPEGWEETALLTTNPQVWSETGEIEGTVEYNEDGDIDGPLDIAFALVRDKPQLETEPEEDDSAETATTDNTKEAVTESETKMTENVENGTPTEETETKHTEEEAEAETDTEGEPVNQQQRIIIVGETDFLSNMIIGYGGNLKLGLKIMNWLAQDDNFIAIPTKTAVDLNLEFSPNAVIFLGVFFLFFLPLALISTGISIWLRRRKA